MSNRKRQPQRKAGKGKAKKTKKNNNSVGGAPKNGGYANAAPAPRVGSVVRDSARKTSNFHVKSTCSILDPFCSNARGARLPDGVGTKTIGQQLRGKFSIVGGITGAVNNGAAVFMSGAPYGYAVASAVSGGNYNFGAAWSQYNGGSWLTSNCRNYRIVSFGVLARCTSSVPSTSGSICFNTLSPDWSVINSDNIAPGSTDYEEQQSFPLATGAQYTWIAKPQGSASREFVSFTGPASDFNLLTADYPSLTNLCVEITGSSNSTVVEFEYFMNLEAQVKPLNAISKFVPPATKQNPLAVTSKNNIVQAMNAASPGGVEAVEKWAVGAATKALAGYAGGPLAAAFAAMTVD